MDQKFNYPKSETELKTALENLFLDAQKAIGDGQQPRFKGLLEIIASEANILTAIHKVKANRGSDTAGADGLNIREAILEKEYLEVISLIQGKLVNYKPSCLRRVWIPKPGKKEKRPLGIPAIIDRIIQECVRNVLEPIFEAQFFKHSYGFRPMRDAHMALERVTDVIHKTGYHWVVEGDISKFFDNVNHSILLRKMWNMGIRDRRVLMIIKAMLKAGVLDELKTSQLGTPQGGIISPLLANVYLHILDEWIVREWEEKRTRYHYVQHGHRLSALRELTNLKPAYLVRYADDWVLVTSTKSNAEKWKQRIAKYLDTNLRLKLSEDKTTVTCVRQKPIRFLGFEVRVRRARARKGLKTETRPIPEKVSQKVKEIHTQIKKIRKIPDKNKVVHEINVVNSKIRGIIQYYEPATRVYKVLAKFGHYLTYAAYKSLKEYGGKWTPAKTVYNLPSVHQDYESTIPAITVEGITVGITDIRFCKWRKTKLKNPKETPYTEDGRLIYQKRSNSKPPLARMDEYFNLQFSKVLAYHRSSLYNFEFYLNRIYAFNRDKGKCRICGESLHPQNLHTHHVQPTLPLDKVNKVPNLASVHASCHKWIHDGTDLSEILSPKIRRKVNDFREKLSHYA